MYPQAQVTALGVRQYGSVTFYIEGYDENGVRVAGAEDRIMLYIDNNGPNFDIESVTMGTQHGGDCALFNLGGVLDAPLTVKFRALQLEGFLDTYALKVRKGNIGDFAIGGPYLRGAYAPGSDDPCCSYEGTFEFAIPHDTLGYVTADITPSSGHWLDPGDPHHPPQPFCTFAIQVTGGIRVTDGYNAGGPYASNEYLLGIQAS